MEENIMEKNEVSIIDVAKDKTFHIFVEFSKNDIRKVEFHTDHVTGAQIKEKAGVPSNSDLGRRVEGKIEFISDDQIIEIKNGEHFVVLPAGTIS
jgi:hypothetical protein